MTSSGAVVIRRRYVSPDGINFEPTASWQVVGGGDVDPVNNDDMVTEPIDFDGELAERERTHEPLPPLDSDPTNTLFGI